MAETAAGRVLVAKAILGESYTPFTEATARLGVGNGTAAESSAHTDLQGGSKVRLPMQENYPQRVGNILTFRAHAGLGEAVFDWQEVGIFNAASGGDMLRRTLRDFGVKPSGQIWALQIQLEVGDGS